MTVVIDGSAERSPRRPIVVVLDDADDTVVTMWIDGQR
jgi:hypothetical protein